MLSRSLTVENNLYFCSTWKWQQSHLLQRHPVIFYFIENVEITRWPLYQPIKDLCKIGLVDNHMKYLQWIHQHLTIIKFHHFGKYPHGFFPQKSRNRLWMVPNIQWGKELFDPRLNVQVCSLTKKNEQSRLITWYLISLLLGDINIWTPATLPEVFLPYHL